MPNTHLESSETAHLVPSGARFRHTVRLPGALGLAVGALCLFTAGAANAKGGSRLGLDLDYAIPIQESGVDPGKGLALRYGYKLDLVVLSITPEVGGGAYWFGGVAEPRLLAGSLGGRVAFGKVLEPGIFAHVGYGSLKVLDESRSGPTVDAGLTLDLTIIPLVDLGVHAAYDAVLIKDSDAFDWVRVGVHAALAF
jgi:hypothetical protein